MTRLEKRQRSNDETRDPFAIADREQRLFKLLVEEYLEQGTPVGSKTLSEPTAIAVSPATVRNIMSDLERACGISIKYPFTGFAPRRLSHDASS